MNHDRTMTSPNVRALARVRRAPRDDHVGTRTVNGWGRGIAAL